MASTLAAPALPGGLAAPEPVLPKLTAVDKVGGILCHICNCKFANKKLFDNHYSQHDTGSEETIYTCLICNKQSTSYPSFRGHCYLNHIVKNKFQCEYCSKKFSKPCILSSHVAAVHEYKCSSCKNQFTSKRDLEIHKKIVHESCSGPSEPPYTCALCPARLESLAACEAHLDAHREELFPCPICGGEPRARAAAELHLAAHYPPEPAPAPGAPPPPPPVATQLDDQHLSKKFQCEQCGKAFSLLGRLVIHTEAFHAGAGEPGAGGAAEGKPWACAECGRRYMTVGRLLEHGRAEHAGRAARARCLRAGCAATFESARALVRHLGAHRRLDGWCRRCGLELRSLAAARRHLPAHGGARHRCPVCARAFPERRLLARHVPAHFEAVLHLCRACGAGFAARRRLVQHLKLHAAARRHACALCSKSFLKPHELRQHLNTHTGRRPYACPRCAKAFSNHPNWSKHLARVHRLDKPAIRELHLELKRAEAAAAPPAPAPGAAPPPPAAAAFASDESGGEEAAPAPALAAAVRAAIHAIDTSDLELDWPGLEPAPSPAPAACPAELAREELERRSAAHAHELAAIVDQIDAMSEELRLAAGAPAAALAPLTPLTPLTCAETGPDFPADGPLGAELALAIDPRLALRPRPARAPAPPRAPAPAPAPRLAKLCRYDAADDLDNIYIY